MTMVSREPRQIIGHAVSRDKTSQTIQCMVDTAPDAERYCTDGYSGYLDIVYPGKHIFNIHNKKDTFTVEGVNAAPLYSDIGAAEQMFSKKIRESSSRSSRFCPGL